MKLSGLLLPGSSPFFIVACSQMCVHEMYSVKGPLYSMYSVSVCKLKIWQSYLEIMGWSGSVNCEWLQCRQLGFIPLAVSVSCLMPSPYILLPSQHFACGMQLSPQSIAWIKNGWFGEFQPWDMTPCRYPEDYGCTNSRRQVVLVTPKILRWLVDVWKICGPILKIRHSTCLQNVINTHGGISMKTVIFTSTALRISNLRS